MENFTQYSKQQKKDELKTLLAAIEKIANMMIEQETKLYVTELVVNLAMDAYEAELYKALSDRFIGSKANVIPLKPRGDE